SFTTWGLNATANCTPPIGGAALTLTFTLKVSPRLTLGESTVTVAIAVLVGRGESVMFGVGVRVSLGTVVIVGEMVGVAVTVGLAVDVRVADGVGEADPTVTEPFVRATFGMPRPWPPMFVVMMTLVSAIWAVPLAPGSAWRVIVATVPGPVGPVWGP